MSGYFLGVDGGQSSTTALIGDETGQILGVGRGGPCNHVGGPEGLGRFILAIRGSLRGAAKQAGLNVDNLRFTSACLGLSGGPEDKESILGGILASDRILVTDDARIA